MLSDSFQFIADNGIILPPKLSSKLTSMEILLAHPMNFALIEGGEKANPSLVSIPKKLGGALLDCKNIFPSYKNII